MLRTSHNEAAKHLGWVRAQGEVCLESVLVLSTAASRLLCGWFSFQKDGLSGPNPSLNVIT